MAYTDITASLFKSTGEVVEIISGSPVQKLVQTKNIPISASAIYSDRQLNLSTRSIPNYLQRTDYINIPGRTENNLYARDYPISASAPSNPFLSGEQITSLPERTSNKSVIAIKFSAPGGKEVSSRGYLDREAEERASFNSLNHRNFAVRSESLKQQRLHTNIIIPEDSFQYYRLGTGSFRRENEGILAVATTNYNPILTGSRLHFWFRVTNDQDGAIVTDQSNNCVSSMHVINNNGSTYDIGIHSSSYGYQNDLYTMSLILNVGTWYNAFMGQLSSNNFYYFISVTGSHYFVAAGSNNQQGLSGLVQFGQSYSSSMPAGAAIDIRAPVYLSPSITNTQFLLEIADYHNLGPAHDPRQAYGNWNPSNAQLLWVGAIENGVVENLGQKTGYPLTVVSQSVDSTPFFGYQTGTATIHKVHKNTRYKIKVSPDSLISNSSYIATPKYDNGFFNYQIPYNIDQVQWVYRTFLKNATISTNKFVNNDAMTASEYYYTESVRNSGSLVSSLTNDYASVYGFPTWIQIRAGDSWKNRFLKNKNLIIRYRRDINNDNREVISQPSYFTGTETLDTDSLEVNRYVFKESPVDYSGEIVEYIMDNNLIIVEPTFNDVFLNAELNNFTGKTNSNKSLINEKLLTNSRKKIKKRLFPTVKTSGHKRTRQRNRFIFTAWRDDTYIRGSDLTNVYPSTVNNGRPNILNSRMADSSVSGYTIPTLAAFDLTGSIWPLDSYLHPTNQTTGSRRVQGELMNSAIDEFGIYYTQRNFPSIVSYMTKKYRDGSAFEILPWTAYSGANSVPFQDSESLFSLYTSAKYKDYCIPSEWNMSSFIASGNFSTLKQTLYENSFNFYNTGSDYQNLITDAHLIKSKLSFDINAVLQLRPYKNFYPCQFTLQCAKELSSSLAQVPEWHNYIMLPYNSTALSTGMMPFFAPGILYSSIKAGMPMPFFRYNTDALSQTIADFEYIFDPSILLKNQSVLGIYMSQSFSSEKYKNIMKNFMHEVKDTFCENSSLEYFESKKESEFSIFESGVSYIMDIIVDTGKLDVSGSISHQANRSIIGGVNYLGSNHGFDTHNVPIWWPGDGNNTDTSGVKIARLIFNPDQTRKYTLDEIFALTNVYYFRFPFYYEDISSSENSLYPKITSSFNIFEKISDQNGDAKWKINSKWEFPYLILTGNLDRFSASSVKSGRSNEDSNGGLDGDNGRYVQYHGGLWHDFCEVPQSDQGIFIQLKDYKYTFVTGANKYQTGSISTFSSASLAAQVGFPINSKKRIGEINSQKKISEMICIVPILKNNNSFINIDNSFNIYNENHKLVEKYVVPPKLDYENGNGKLFFGVEIDDTWSRRDLAYIWQNLLPQNGLRHAEKNKLYEVTDQRVLDLLKDKDIYFMVFKCKMRSTVNDYPNIGYNWPWDFCSLVDLIKIDIITEEEI